MMRADPAHGAGRPLRFLVLVLGGWIAARVAITWPSADPVLRSPVALAAGRPALASAAVAEPAGSPARHSPVSAAYRPARSAPLIARDRRAPMTRPGRGEGAGSHAAAPALAPGTTAAAAAADAPLLAGVPTPARARSRWSASAWVVARGGAETIAPGVVGGLLGGSQAGLRLAYAIDRRHRVALAGRLTTPLGAGLRESALGVEWQPTRAPLRIVAEERFALGGGSGRGGPAIGVVGGFGPVAIPAGFRLEGYGEAGVIRRAATEPYADGAVRAARPFATLGRARLGAGGGIWAAAQRGAARVDLGPALTLDLPVAKHGVRLSLDYRLRVAGDARPGSGPALTLGTDF